ncbi:MAG TPA: TIGR03560 family F420-dependent LLM class oxidoreductase [Candidatus Dormibacteraeota bacterium]
MRFGLDVAQQRLTWEELLGRVQFAESAGFDGVWGFDHFKPMYGDTPGPCFEGMTVLAALAAATQRIRLGLLVTGVTYRHPSVLAAEAVTIDHVSSGRLELALGAAWFDEEHRELGIDFPPLGQRFDRLADTLEVVHRLMSGQTVSYEGRTLRLDGARLLPLPVQRPHPPIWIGGSGERRTIPLAARYADMWHCFGSVEGLRAKSALLDGLAEAAGRDPRSIGRAASLSLSGDLDEARRSAERWQQAGFSYLVCGWPGEGRGRVEEFVTGVLPAFAG